MINKQSIEWFTLVLFFIVYFGWSLIIINHTSINLVLLIISLSFLVALHSSLQHEVIHGHPTPWPIINHFLAFFSLGLAVPFKRYEDLHLKHHRNRYLTDPIEDPESYFMKSHHWSRCNAIVKNILQLNNSLFGRLILGPIIMMVRMIKTEYYLSKEDNKIKTAWLQHLLSVFLVISFLWITNFPIVLYLLGVAYPALSLLSLRSYSEHLPEEKIADRSAIIKSNWLMQLLYLNNNFHRVHHDYPDIPWYHLPRLYREQYLQDTKHVYSGYFSLVKQYALKQRFCVEHPFLSKD